MATYVIAEMACSHDGDPELARQIVDAAGSAGADAVQFQMWRLEEMVVPDHPDVPLLRRLELAPETWRELAAFSRERHPRMEIVACVYEAPSVELAEGLGVEAYKIHTSDLSNPRLLARVAATGRRVDLSVGGSTIDEIAAAVERLRRGGASETWLMHGLQAFPTPIEDARLAWLVTLKRLFGLRVGYQDHTAADSPAAFWLPAAARGMGIDVIEKHVTHDRSRRGADHEAALEPRELARFVEMLRAIDAAQGAASPTPFSEAEERYRRYSKKSLVAARALAAGHVVAAEDLCVRRAPEPGLPPDAEERLLGRRTRRALRAFERVLDEELE